MAITYQGAGTGNDGGFEVSSIDCAIPAGGTNDVVIVLMYTDGGGTITVPSGWTDLGEVSLATNEKVRSFWKAFTTSGSSTVTISFANTINPIFSQSASAWAWRFSGVDTAGAVAEGATATASTSSGSSTPHNGVTVAAGNVSVVFGKNNTTAHTPPSGWTEHYDSATAWCSSREYSSTTATGTVNTTHSTTTDRVGYHVELAALSVQTVGANHLGPTSSLHQPAVTVGPVTVVVPHLTTGQVYNPGVQPGPISVVAQHIGPTSSLHQPAVVVDYTIVAPGPLNGAATVFEPGVQPGPVTVALNHLGPVATVHNQGIFLGSAIAVPHLGPTATLLDPAVVPGSVTIGMQHLSPTTALFQPGPVHQETRVPHIGPTATLYSPTTVAYVPMPHLGPTATVFAQLIGQYVVLAEPDVVEWGASGGFTARVDFLDAAGQTIASTDNPNSRIVLVGGSVNEDDTQEVKRQCDLRLLLVSSDDDPGGRHPLLPAKPGDPLDPRTGGKVAVYAGQIRPSGTPDYVKLGVFKITAASPESTATGDRLTIRGLSQEHEIRSAGFWQVAIIADGTRVVDAILGLVVEVMPDVDWTAEASPITTTEISYSDNDDRLKAVLDLSRSIAYGAEFDRQGVFRLRRSRQFGDEPDQTPRWTFREGEKATVRDMSREIDDATLHNGVVVVGEPLDTNADPFRAEVWDTRPSSPVYYDPNNPGASLTGPRPLKIVTKLVTSYQQAEELAAAELSRILAFPDRISVSLAANPKIEKNDVVRVIRSTMGVDALYRVESVTHDLLGAASRAVCVAI